MSNVPQDDVFESREFYEVCQLYRHAQDNGDAAKAFEILKDFIRAQRSNAEPVAKLTSADAFEMCAERVNDFDSITGFELWCKHMAGDIRKGLNPHFVPILPAYDAGVAAGMMKAAEMCDDCQVSWDVHRVNDDTLWNNACTTVKSAILSAIPADSKAALREVCMKVAKAVWDYASITAPVDSEIESLIDSVLEGK